MTSRKKTPPFKTLVSGTQWVRKLLTSWPRRRGARSSLSLLLPDVPYDCGEFLFTKLDDYFGFAAAFSARPYSWK